ncbi:glycosyltransferase [Flavobacterium sp. ANB]|uniref:glycosyltransferase family 2 protein n=1 Tax=unclassified Flavobacterium TaxID=196869 RepID=UPI0012B9E8A5|nr:MULTISPECIES: glycosyltransferase family 2 protein [unclassified Flavobacterium]MBF4517622.1 glycosyltransferase [Flavobacterium sp. ANB]MTD70349.1 glycosyltransferase [Flavobacterium sp. LC2016-13]
MISIITVVRNGASTIEQTILSVLSQDYPDFEYVIVDGVSTDGTLDILEKYSDKIRYVSESDAGIYDAMNKGISLAKGDWLYFLGCDDVFYNNSVLSNIFSNSKYSEFNVVYGNVQFLHSNVVFDGVFDDVKMYDRTICHQAIFYRKEVFVEYGNFSIEYKTASDHIFNVYVYCFNPKAWHYINQIVAIYNEKGASEFADAKFLDDCFEICYKNFKKLKSKFILGKIFWSSFFRYFKTHDKKNAKKYFWMVIKDVGVWSLFSTLLILIKKKYLNAS